MAHPLSLEASSPLKSRSALDNREVSSPVEEGAMGEVEGRFIAKKYKVSKCLISKRDEDGRMQYGQQPAFTLEQ